MRPETQKIIKAQLQQIETTVPVALPTSAAHTVTTETASPVLPEKEVKSLPLKNWAHDALYCSRARTGQWFRLAALLLLLAICGIVFMKSVHTLILIGFTMLLWQCFFGLSKDPSLVSASLVGSVMIFLSTEVFSRSHFVPSPLRL
jgi:hypothetical protein